MKTQGENEEMKRNMSMKDEKKETCVLRKRGKASVLDCHVDEIRYLLNFGLSFAKTYDKILEKLPSNKQISYNGFYRFCKRNRLMII